MERSRILFLYCPGDFVHLFCCVNIQDNFWVIRSTPGVHFLMRGCIFSQVKLSGKMIFFTNNVESARRVQLEDVLLITSQSTRFIFQKVLSQKCINPQQQYCILQHNGRRTTKHNKGRCTKQTNSNWWTTVNNNNRRETKLKQQWTNNI